MAGSLWHPLDPKKVAIDVASGFYRWHPSGKAVIDLGNSIPQNSEVCRHYGRRGGSRRAADVHYVGPCVGLCLPGAVKKTHELAGDPWFGK